MTVKIACLYAPEDFESFSKLERHMSPLFQNDYAKLSHPGSVPPGGNVEIYWEKALDEAHILLVLLSANLLSGARFSTQKQERIVHRRLTQNLNVIPVLLSECAWDLTLIADLRPLPNNNLFIATDPFWMPRPDSAFAAVVRGVKDCCHAVMPFDRQKALFINQEIKKVAAAERSRNESLNTDGPPPAVLSTETQMELELAQLAESNPRLERLLRASCYDLTSDIGGRLTPLLFRHWLFAQTKEIALLKERFHQLIFNDWAAETRLIFLTGFAGNGKTTFMRTFLEDNYGQFEYVLFDLDDVLVDRHDEHPEQQDGLTERAVLSIIGKVMRRSELFPDAFRIIYRNRHLLFEEEFVSLDFYTLMEKSRKKPEDITSTDLAIWLNQLGYKDTFTCFFIYLFYRTSDDDQRKVIVFDNLDTIRLEHLAQHFLQKFGEAIYNAPRILRSTLFADRHLDFSQQYKFVFCLRDASYEYLNAHLNPHVRSRMGLARQVAFHFSLDSNHFYDLVRKRLNFFHQLCVTGVRPDAMDEFLRHKAWFDALIHDEYYSRVFVPLYNNDYRASIRALYAVAQSALGHKAGTDVRDNAISLRGVMMFELIKGLRANDFLHDLTVDNMFDTGKKVKPYCFLDRMMLTVLLNLSGLNDPSELEDIQPVSLQKIVWRLRAAYDVKEILKSVARCFLYHKKDWVHLVSVLEKEVNSVEEFVAQTSQMSMEQLAEIKVRLNPAGFTYLRFVLPHFEFYNLAAGQTKSLFLFDGESKFNKATRELEFDFEPVIEQVFVLMSRHIEAMALFYVEQFKPIFSPEEYRGSDFAFKHPGYGYRQNTGYFHSTRIITTHIRYLDNFRKFFLHRQNLPDNLDRKRANAALVKKIEQYVNLLKKSVDDRAVKDFVAGFEAKIAQIRGSGFEDFESAIEVSDL